MEVFGAAASVVGVLSFSLELAEKVQKLHDFWESYKQASEDIQDIVIDLQTFCDALRRSCQSRSGEDKVLLKVLLQCHTKIAKLEKMAKKLESGLASEIPTLRKWTAIRVVLNKDKIKEFRASLTETKIDLLLLNQAIIEQSRRSDISLLSDLIAGSLSQQPRPVNTVVEMDSRSLELTKHVNDIQSEVQQIARQLQSQANLPAPAFVGGKIENALLRIIQQVVQSPEMQEVARDFSLVQISDVPSASKDAKSYSEALSETLKGDSHQQITSNNLGDIEDTKEGTTSYSTDTKMITKRRVLKDVSGEYNLWVGTLKWRTRWIRVTHTNLAFGKIEHFELETYIDLLPAQWLLARNIGLRLSKTSNGWDHCIRYYPHVPYDALIFKYCENGNVDGIRDLIQHKMASPWDVDPRGFTPLHQTAFSQQASVCQFLMLAGANINAVTGDGRTPLLMASSVIANVAYRDPWAVAYYFIEHEKMDITLADEHGLRLVNLLVQHGDSLHKGLDWLLSRNDLDVDMSAPGHHSTALMNVFQMKSCNVRPPNEELVEKFIDLGVDINSQFLPTNFREQSGYTALHFAIFCLKDSESHMHWNNYIFLLLRRGADPQIPDNQGRTPTALALKSSWAFDVWRRELYRFWVDIEACSEVEARVESFVQVELDRSTFLRDEEWDARSLSELFKCEYYPIDPKAWISLGGSHSISMAVRSGLWKAGNRENWWYDLKSLIQLDFKPIPPLASGWSESLLPDGVRQYTHEESGVMTFERPNGLFFSNLIGANAQWAYHKGEIWIETRVPCHWVYTEEDCLDDVAQKRGLGTKIHTTFIKEKTGIRRKRRIWLEGNGPSDSENVGIQRLGPGSAYAQYIRLTQS